MDKGIYILNITNDDLRQYDAHDDCAVKSKLKNFPKVEKEQKENEMRNAN